MYLVQDVPYCSQCKDNVVKSMAIYYKLVGRSEEAPQAQEAPDDGYCSGCGIYHGLEDNLTPAQWERIEHYLRTQVVGRG